MPGCDASSEGEHTRAFKIGHLTFRSCVFKMPGIQARAKIILLGCYQCCSDKLGAIQNPNMRDVIKFCAFSPTYDADWAILVYQLNSTAECMQ